MCEFPLGECFCPLERPSQDVCDSVRLYSHEYRDEEKILLGLLNGALKKRFQQFFTGLMICVVPVAYIILEIIWTQAQS